MNTRLTLFVCGKSPASLRAIHSANILMESLNHQCVLEIVDVLEDPERAEESRILATPTLVRSYPPPVRILVGDLTDFDRVLTALNLYPVRNKEVTR